MKKIVIMGASSGIGYHMAELLASRGMKVGLAARHTSTLQQHKDRYPDCVEYMSIDVTKPEAVDRLTELAEKTGGMVNTNAAGFARMVCAAYRYFRDKGVRGQIAAVTSVAGTNGIGRLSAYSATKKFGQTYLVALEQLAREEGADIAFTDIRPGWVDTPLLTKGVEYPMEMDVEYATRLILKAIVRKRRVAVIDWRWNLVVGGWKMIPNFLWTRMDVKISNPDAGFPAPGQPSVIVGGDDA